MFEVA